jgi:peptidoglycan-associated lipoprotein
MPRFRWLILVLVLLLVLPACAKKEAVPIEEEVEPIEEVPPPPPPLEEEPEPEEVVEEAEPIILEDVFFDFDKYNVKDEYKSVLSGNADILIANPEVKLLVEGHCDERGTNEYNLALGEKRAKAVIDFLVAYGVQMRRLSMVSYGEERPFDSGHDEAAWAKNRRAHMVMQ